MFAGDPAGGASRKQRHKQEKGLVSDMRIVAALMAVLMLVAIVPAVSAEQTVTTQSTYTSVMSTWMF